METNEDKTIYLLSNFTHQVINPLNAVIGTLDNVIDGTVPSDRVRTRLNSARGQLECTVSLVRNLAFFAQYTSDYATTVRNKSEKICVIPQLLIEAAQFFQEQGRLFGNDIEINDQWNQLAVKGNPDLLRQVFMNIFDNGIKYGLRDEKIEVTYWLKVGTGEVIIEIAGKSVGYNTSEDIFGLGTRGRAAQAKTSSGSGIGLHICKLIVESVFSGKIQAEHSRASRVTKFIIWLPGGFNNTAKT